MQITPTIKHAYQYTVARSRERAAGSAGGDNHSARPRRPSEPHMTASHACVSRQLSQLHGSARLGTAAEPPSRPRASGLSHAIAQICRLRSPRTGLTMQGGRCEAPRTAGLACKPHAELRASRSNAGHGKLRMQSRLPDMTMDTTQSLPHATHRDSHATTHPERRWQQNAHLLYAARNCLLPACKMKGARQQRRTAQERVKNKRLSCQVT